MAVRFGAKRSPVQIQSARLGGKSTGRIDTSAEARLYAPPHHKTAWRGKARAVAVGPKAQAVLKPFWPAGPTEYVFSPRRAVDALHARLSGDGWETHAPHEAHGAWSFYFRAKGGYFVEVTTLTPIRPEEAYHDGRQ